MEVTLPPHPPELLAARPSTRGNSSAAVGLDGRAQAPSRPSTRGQKVAPEQGLGDTSPPKETPQQEEKQKMTKNPPNKPQGKGGKESKVSEPEEPRMIGGGQHSEHEYELSREIGRGKFSTVHMGKRMTDGMPVAIKKVQIYDIMDTNQRDKCLKEVNLFKSLDHDHIVRYLDSFVEENELLIIFEWAEGGDLRKELRRRAAEKRHYDEKHIWTYFQQICEAVKHMKERRVMHRDIKPANIMVSKQGGLKLGDLGLGRYFSSQTIEAFSKVGTPLYMSPEVLKGAGYDWKSDIWSLGCLLYELARLKSPFKGEGLNLYALFKKITSADYTKLEPGQYSEDLCNLCLSMMDLEAKQRPDIEDVCETIANVVKKIEENEAKNPGGAGKMKVDGNGHSDQVSGDRAGSEVAGRGGANAIALMDDAVDKLKLLDYEERFVPLYGLLPLCRHAFAMEGGDGLPVESGSGCSSQLAYLYCVIEWLVALQSGKSTETNRRDVFKSMRERESGQVASLLLECLRKANFSIDLAPARIQKGFGDVVCQLLNKLLDITMRKCAVVIHRPTYCSDDEASRSDDDGMVDTMFIETMAQEAVGNIPMNVSPPRMNDKSKRGTVGGKKGHRVLFQSMTESGTEVKVDTRDNVVARGNRPVANVEGKTNMSTDSIEGVDSDDDMMVAESSADDYDEETDHLSDLPRAHLEEYEQRMAFVKRDPSEAINWDEWNAEVERFDLELKNHPELLKRQLKIAGTDFRDRAEIMRINSKKLMESRVQASRVITEAADVIGTSFGKIEAREKVLNRQVEPLLNKYKAVREKMKEKDNSYEYLRTAVEGLSLQLQEMEDRQAEVLEKLAEMKAENANNKPVKVIRASIKKLKRENGELSVRTGLVEQMLRQKMALESLSGKLDDGVNEMVNELGEKLHFDPPAPRILFDPQGSPVSPVPSARIQNQKQKQKMSPRNPIALEKSFGDVGLDSSFDGSLSKNRKVMFGLFKDQSAALLREAKGEVAASKEGGTAGPRFSPARKKSSEKQRSSTNQPSARKPSGGSVSGESLDLSIVGEGVKSKPSVQSADLSVSGSRIDRASRGKKS